LNDVRVTNKLLDNVRVAVKLRTGDGVDVDKTFANVKFDDDKESVVTFTVPNEPRSIRISVECEVKNMSQNTRQSLSKSAEFKCNSIDSTSSIAQMFLIPKPNHAFMVALYGKNGEGIAMKDISLSLTSKDLKSNLSLSLSTDERGRVHLPPNLTQRFTRLRASCSSPSINNEWDLNHGINACDTVRVVQMTSNASVCVPYTPSIADDRNAFALFDSDFRARYDADHLQFDANNGYLTITDLPAGRFILKCLDLDHDINVHVTQRGQVVDDGRLNVNDSEIVQLSPEKPLQISAVEQSQKNVVQIRMSGVSESTRVHIVATHMMPRFSLSTYLDCVDASSLNNTVVSQSKSNFYLPSRTIGEELRYILEREKAQKFVGNSLIRPSFLVKPLEHQQTSNRTQTAAAGDMLLGMGLGRGHVKHSAAAMRFQSQQFRSFDESYVGYGERCSDVSPF